LDCEKLELRPVVKYFLEILGISKTARMLQQELNLLEDRRFPGAIPADKANVPATAARISKINVEIIELAVILYPNLENSHVLNHFCLMVMYPSMAETLGD